MASATRQYKIFQGTPIAASLGVTTVSVGSTGDPSARRRLVHPNVALPPIIYDQNPDTTSNFDQDVLLHPLSDAIMALADTKLVRFETELRDRIIIETWVGASGRASMPTFFFRQLYEYLVNPPPASLTAPTFIRWEPRDRTSKTYHALLFKLTVGNGAESQEFVVRDYAGGPIVNPEIQGALEGLNEDPSGVELESVQVHLLLVEEVV